MLGRQQRLDELALPDIAILSMRRALGMRFEDDHSTLVEQAVCHGQEWQYIATVILEYADFSSEAWPARAFAHMLFALVGRGRDPFEVDRAQEDALQIGT
jgi:hypothetical protein